MKTPVIPGLNIPVRSIYCIGRNYANHAKEMNAPIPKIPIIFQKPLGTICFDGDSVCIPPISKEIHHEGELVLAIGETASHINTAQAHHVIAGVGAGIDFTARDLQQLAKKAGQPWTLSKGFDHFAPISNFISVDEQALEELSLICSVNQEIRQQGNVSEMIFSPTELVAYLSSVFTLEQGDLIFTGTPEGVSQVQAGDVVTTSLSIGSSVTVTLT